MFRELPGCLHHICLKSYFSFSLHVRLRNVTLLQATRCVKVVQSNNHHKSMQNNTIIKLRHFCTIITYLCTTRKTRTIWTSCLIIGIASVRSPPSLFSTGFDVDFTAVLWAWSWTWRCFTDADGLLSKLNNGQEPKPLLRTTEKMRVMKKIIWLYWFQKSHNRVRSTGNEGLLVFSPKNLIILILVISGVTLELHQHWRKRGSEIYV